MRLYMDVWGDDIQSPEDFWDLVVEVADSINELGANAEGWRVTEIGVDSHRVLYKNGREQPLLTKLVESEP